VHHTLQHSRMPTSENAVKAKFAELQFHALR
jgi:hypothetical protein